MSTLGGIYNLDGAPVDECLLSSLGDKLASHAPDGGNKFLQGFLGMTYRAFHTNDESCLEIQPLTSNYGNVLCWDGRLDNRIELISTLCNELWWGQTDAGIVLASYLKWGLDFLQRITGDFALSLWDPGSRMLLLARDPVGPRPLFYHITRQRIIWSSELTPLLDVCQIDLEVNEEYVADYLAREPEPHRTPYRGVHALAPGNFMIVRNGQPQTQRFWNPEPGREIRYKTDAEYEDHFRDLFREAVRCRLRANTPVWATLSGGLDSSSIVCMADQILKSEKVQATKLETVSWVYDESVTSDERAFICCVEEGRGRTGCHLREEDYHTLGSLSDNSFISFPNFIDCFIARHRGMCQAMAEDGARVLLTGHGGDEMLCSGADPSPELADLLIQFQPWRLHQRLRTWSQGLKKPYLQLLWRNAVLPLLPLSFRVAWAPTHSQLPAWYNQTFVERMNLRERHLGPRDVFGFRLASELDHILGFLSVSRIISTAAYRERGGIEVSHPYLHLPLVEFLQAIPFEQKVRPGETRSLLRRSMRDLLPPKILNRRSKRGPEEALYRAVAREWNQLQPIFINARVCDRGYINAESLMTALQRARHGCERHSFALIKVIALEFWLRALELRRPTAKSAAQSTTSAMAAAQTAALMSAPNLVSY